MPKIKKKFQNIISEQKKIVIGGLVAVFALAFSFLFVPFTPINLQASVIGDLATGGKAFESNIDLSFLSFPIHHYVIGMALMAISLFLAPVYAPYAFGFGLILFLDQLPLLLGFGTFK